MALFHLLNHQFKLQIIYTKYYHNGQNQGVRGKTKHYTKDQGQRVSNSLKIDIAGL